MTDVTFEVLRASDPAERDRWILAWDGWPEREVFAHPSYVELFCSGEDAALAAIAKRESVSVMYPFVLRSLGRERYAQTGESELADISSPYGYGGPYWWGEGDRPGAAAAFWRAFDHWASGARVVSEFVRFDLHAGALAPFPGESLERSLNVIRSLESDPDELWMDVAHKVRKNVNRARSRGLTFIVDEDGDQIDDFIRIYMDTMSRRGAPSRYLFSREWFLQLTQTLRGQFAYFHVMSGNTVVSSELVLLSPQHAYSFLGGTDPSGFDSRANDLLKWEVALWAQSRGMREFVLGGGFESDDGIFRYKAAFAPSGIAPFLVGTRVHDERNYTLLSQRAAELRGTASPPGFFPAYRG